VVQMTSDEVTELTVPAYSGQLAPLPAARRRAFAAHLRTIIAEAFADPAPRVRASESKGVQSAATEAACAACRWAVLLSWRRARLPGRGHDPPDRPNLAGTRTTRDRGVISGTGGERELCRVLRISWRARLPTAAGAEIRSVQ
jgi:hypothetical protein